MNKPVLSHILEDRARAIIDEMDDPNVPGYRDRHNDAEMLRVLARILRGESIERAFGAPGDWGYGTPIGDAIRSTP